MAEPASTDLAPRDKPAVPVGVAPGTLDEAWRWAQQAAQSSIVPAAYRGKPHDILTAIQLGVEVGLPPMTALQSIAVINGRPGLFGDGLLALVLASAPYLTHQEYFEVERPDPVLDEAGEAPRAARMVRVEALDPADLAHDSTRAVCTVWRRRAPDPTTRTFSVAQARRAGLIFNKPGPWNEYPDRMLQMRARGFALRDAFPDVLKGLRPVEELADLPPDVAPPAPAVRRRSDPQEAPE